MSENEMYLHEVEIISLIRLYNLEGLSTYLHEVEIISLIRRYY